MTRGIFHNTWGGSKWPFHLEIPPGALNMTTNSRKPSLTLDLLPKFYLDTADTCCYREPFIFLFKNSRYFDNLTSWSLLWVRPQPYACRTWPPCFLWWWRGSSFNICSGCWVCTHSFSPNSTGLLMPLFPKLRFMQSSGTNECGVNLSRHQSDSGR